MKVISSLLAGIALLGALAYSETPARPSPPKPPEKGGIKDPRAAPLLNLIYRDGANHAFRSQSHAILIFARDDAERPNSIIGIEGSFTDEQIIAALKRFYREWQPPKDYPSTERPSIILAKQGWGSGAPLYKALKDLSAEFQLDVYQFDGVRTHFEVQAYHPTPNDKRLGELIPLTEKTGPKFPPK